MDGISGQLAEYALGITWDDVPSDVVHALERCLVDGVACAMGAVDAEPVAVLRRLASQRPDPSGCSIWGSRLRTHPELAALVNATMVRFLDFNDHYVAAHPSDLMAAVLATGETRRAGARDTLLALLVTYEVHCALARLPWRANGWDQGVFGVVATACGAGRLRGLSPDQLADAIAVAVLNHVSLRQNRAGGLSMWKGVAVPYAAQAALFAVELVAAGLTGPRRPFEGDDGVFHRLMGPFELPSLGGAGGPFRTLDVDFKYWPVEFNGQLAVWAGREIRARTRVEEIERIRVWTYHLGWDEIGREPEKWDPRTRETADHSLPYLLAVALQRGEVGLSDFDPSAYLDPRHRVVMNKIEVEPDDEITAAYPERMRMRVRVESSEGTFDLDLDEPRGRAANPMSDAELDTKFTDLVAPVLGAGGSEALLRELRELDRRDDLDGLLRLLGRDARA